MRLFRTAFSIKNAPVFLLIFFSCFFLIFIDDIVQNDWSQRRVKRQVVSNQLNGCSAWLIIAEVWRIIWRGASQNSLLTGLFNFFCFFFAVTEKKRYNRTGPGLSTQFRVWTHSLELPHVKGVWFNVMYVFLIEARDRFVHIALSACKAAFVGFENLRLFPRRLFLSCECVLSFRTIILKCFLAIIRNRCGITV